MSHRSRPGLSSQLKDKLIQKALARRLQQVEQASPSALPRSSQHPVPEAYYSFRHHPAYQQVQLIAKGAERLGIEDPFFRQHTGVAGATTQIDGHTYINFSSYNYLGLAGHPAVNAAAKQAVDTYGTSSSASRSVSGERPLHRSLEQALAKAYDCEAALVFVSGHATNVTTLGHLFGPRDLIVHDELCHNSVLQGIKLSGATRLSFPHNDYARLDAILSEQRIRHERVLVIAEGMYSMDGDFPDLPRLVEIKRRHYCFLMVDEAHSFGTMGAHGLGLREHFGLAGKDVDIWMGTLSKTLAGCGGYIAGESALIDNLRFLAPGFLYSVGMPPPIAAASNAALSCMLDEPERVAQLHERSQYFVERARSAGLDTGLSRGIAIAPVILGSSLRAGRLSNALFKRGINVQPILYPAVPEKAARLRFFLSCLHTPEQIDFTVKATAEAMASI